MALLPEAESSLSKPEAESSLSKPEAGSCEYNVHRLIYENIESVLLANSRRYIAELAQYLEVNEKELYKGCGLLPEMDVFLETHGFKRVLMEMTCHGWGDALYVRVKK